MKTLAFILFLVGIIPTISMGQIKATADELYRSYPTYQEQSITHKRIKHRDIEPLIKKLGTPFQVQPAGASMEGRPIYTVQLGTGPVKVLLWSQMHGNEPTATMALMDIFNFFSQTDQFDRFRNAILDKVTLYFIPMLNPDGAERFQRRNALDVDLNRDALRLQSPEAQLLKQVRDQTQADWGFNLHDQNKYYSAGRTNPQTASISFLAPAYNVAKSVNEKRADAMQLIGLMAQILQNYIPAKVAKYDDTFEPRAFGDNIQKWGTRTILIESGGLDGDPEKQELRRLHFVILLSAMHAIATGAFDNYGLQTYKTLPYNGYGAFYDLKLEEVQIEVLGKWYTVDLAWNLDEVEYDEHSRYYPRGSIAEIGDLSPFFAYETVDSKGLRAYPGRVYPNTLSSAEAVRSLDMKALLQEGFTYVRVKGTIPKDAYYHQLPVQLIPADKPFAAPAVKLGHNPGLLIRQGNTLKYVVVNGQLFDFSKM